MSRSIFSITLFACLLATPCLADDAKTKSHVVKHGPFRVEVKLDGVFVAEQMTEIALYPKEWSQFKVVEAVAHGAKVRKGEVLVRFDATDLEDAVADMEADQHLASLAILQAEKNIPTLENSLALALESAVRTADYALADMKRFLEIGRPLSERSAKFRMKNVTNYLLYATEELEQLEKMYKADDLTEESEEIVLTRQRNSVESAQFSVEREKINLAETLNVDLPRKEIDVKNAVEQAKLKLKNAKIESEIKVDQKRFELEKVKHAQARSLEKHAKLLADRALMSVESPVNGVVYYGQCVDGKWPGIRSHTKSLRPKGSISPESVFMTIVNPRPVTIQGEIAEKDLAGFVEGLTARIQPTANPDATIEGRVRSTTSVPIEDGKFGVELTFGAEGSPEWIVPGMTCQIIVTTYKHAAALTIPVKSLRTDDADSAIKYVYVLGEDDKKPRRQEVKVGRTSGDTVEILSGVDEGDRVAIGDVEE